LIPPAPSAFAPPRPVPSLPEQPPKAPTPPEPRDPLEEKAESLWLEFESQNAEDRIAIFLKTLEDDEMMDGELAFEMLSIIHTNAQESGNRTRFVECVAALRQRQPEVYAEGAHNYLSWALLDALAEDRQEVVPSLARELAGRAGRDIDIFNRAKDALAYHGQLTVLVEALRIAWPLVKSSDNVVPWGITNFAERGANHEIFHYIEHSATPDPADPALLDRVRFFIEEPREDYLREYISDLTGTSGREWQTADFALRPPRKRNRNAWDDEPEERETPDPGASKLTRLISEFVGYLRREEGVPFSRGGLVRPELYRYFVRRNDGDLDPGPSMLERARHPNRKLPKPPRPIHPLCPERVTFEAQLAGMMDFMNPQYYSAAALFHAMPAWLRFLESRRLIDAATSKKVAADLLPLRDPLLRIWEQQTHDPLLYRLDQV
jgi:hypothetical protein